MITVFIVEDEDMVRSGLVRTLNWNEMGCTVIGEAANGKQGLDLIKELEPDLVITDIRMPYMDGVTMINQLRSQGCESHFIMLSAHSDFNYAQSAIRAGAVDYLLKPLKDEELKKAIQRVFFAEEEEQKEEKVPMQLQFHPKEAIENKYARQAVQYIKHHYSEDISISSVAEHLQISEGYLSRVFKKETTYTFTNYLSFFRIVMACVFLKDCRMKVYEVTEKVGYSDTAYFSTLFKKMMGVTPTEYQDQI